MEASSILKRNDYSSEKSVITSCFRFIIPEQTFEPRAIEADPILKNTICHFIGGSGHFIMKGYKTVDMPPILLQNETIDVYNTCTGETVKEDVFPCIVVACSEDDTTAFKFYVSHEYDVSDTMLDLELGYSVGRFLFVYENDRFYCDALAEESALTFSRPEHDVERLYLEARRGREIGAIEITCVNNLLIMYSVFTR